MSDKNSYYSVVQFSARPSNFEYVNVGVVIIQPHARQMRVLMSEDAFPIKKLFDDHNAKDFKLMARSFRLRLEHEFEAIPSLAGLEAFAQSRANLFRLLPFAPIMVDDLNINAQLLFEEMVAIAPHYKRKEAPSKRLASLFKQQGVLAFVDNNPDPVILPGFDQPLRADFGYQNGHYNLIDAEHIAPKQELAAVSRIAGKAQLLHRYSDKRLIVVADVPQNHDGLLEVLAGSLHAAEGRFYSFMDPQALVNDIREQALSH